MDEEPLDSHPIELAETRPIMLPFPFLPWLGEVPKGAAILLFAVAGLAWLGFGSIKYFMPIFPAWWFIGWITQDNYHGTTHVKRWLETGGLHCLDRKAQGGVSATPMPQLKNKPRGML